MSDTPQTDAGRALLTEVGSCRDANTAHFILAIEAEAVRSQVVALAEAREALIQISGIASRWLTSPDPTLAREVRRIAVPAIDVLDRLTGNDAH